VTRSLRFFVLGPVEAHDDGRRLALGGRRSRTLVALLLLAPNGPRRRDSLVEAIWGESPPRDADHALDNLVSRVRKALGADVLRSAPGGYVLAVDPEAVDAVRFEALAGEGRAALAAGDPGHAAALLGEALGLWRGEPLADLADEPALADSVRQLADARALAVEDRVDAELALGAHHELLPELGTLVAEEPFRERRRGQLMLALYRAGRHAEALRAYRDGHAYLVTELGLEPGRALRELELAIARHDPALDHVPVPGPASPAAPERAGRRLKPPSARLAPDRPETRYAWSGDVSIAYQVYGHGPIDIVLVPGWVSHLEVAWEHAGYCRFMDRLASFARVVVYDKRGTGLSDPVGAAPSFDPRLDDLSAVLETAGCRRPVLFGWSEGATIAALFTATHPDLVRRLVLYGTYARGPWAEDYPFGLDPGILDAFTETIRGAWGEAVSLTVLGPDRVDDDELRRWWGRFERMSASPSIAASVFALNARMDMRELLPSIHVPTLVVHRVGDMLPIEGARYTAERIPDARLVELPGADHWPWLAGGDDVLEPVEEFVTGKRSSPEPDRVLATVLFSDIVNSTARAAEIGDSEWRMVLMRHDSLVREAIERQRGVIVKSTGDGALARFDRPTAAMQAAREITSALPDKLGLQARVGLHTGELELIDGDVVGITVHVAARIGALAGPGEVLASRTIRDLVLGSGLALREAGTHALKGVPDTWELFALADGQ
jgi:DNA-binding SARP family transcriptional activator/pimeloyl-ACP methyl ester carboxylesterase